MNSSQGTGSDNIPARFIKDAVSVLTKPVTHNVSLTIQTGIVPRSLKNARVVLLFTKNKRSDVSNYWPVSVLSVILNFGKSCVCSIGGLFGEKLLTT